MRSEYGDRSVGMSFHGLPSDPIDLGADVSHEKAGAALETLHSVEKRILWLATKIIDHANRVRPNRSGLKVGGH